MVELISPVMRIRGGCGFLCVGGPQKFRAVARPEHPPTDIPRNATAMVTLADYYSIICACPNSMSSNRLRVRAQASPKLNIITVTYCLSEELSLMVSSTSYSD